MSLRKGAVYVLEAVCLRGGSGGFEGWLEDKQWSTSGMAVGSSSLQEWQQGESTKGILLENTECRLGTETLCKTDLYNLFLLFIKLAVRRNLWVSRKVAAFWKTQKCGIADCSWAFPVVLPDKALCSYVNGWLFSFSRERAGMPCLLGIAQPGTCTRACTANSSS